MSGTVQTSAKMKAKRDMPTFSQIRTQFDRFISQSHPAVEIALKSTFGALQGGGLGYLMGVMMKSSVQSAKEAGGQMNPMMAGMQGNMSPLAQAKGLAALCGVSSGLSVALKKIRGKDDVWTQMGAAAGGGAAFTIASGNYSLPAIANSALLLGLFTGAVNKVMEGFKPEHDDSEFERSKYLLQSLGLSKYEKNVKKGLLTDNTIMLWDDSALKDVKIPPGPRLLILHHLSQLRQWSPQVPTSSPSKPHPVETHTPTESVSGPKTE